MPSFRPSFRQNRNAGCFASRPIREPNSSREISERENKRLSRACEGNNKNNLGAFLDTEVFGTNALSELSEQVPKHPP